ncbi:SDR family oxidoreductase [Oceanobacter mangrovi]|uniref:SDR family oxidoreductase n=1 Tax=Oceanobacter mangrovi TaxID=2862510 RepID=UPI001C8DC54E|nr:SDR family oxidoreductase [Oceanobacter mangrovi]
MDLGLRGKKAIVCAASKGLGRACANALAAEGVDLVINARTESELQRAAEEIQAAYGVSCVAVAVDITTEAGRAAVLAAMPNPDILVNNAGGPPPGNFRDWGRDEWLAAVEANMITPIELIRQVVDGMSERGWGRIINITSSAVKAPINILGLSNGARAGLTGFVAGLARDVIAHGVTVNNLLPGSFYTDRLRNTLNGLAVKSGSTVDDIANQRRAGIPAQRFGEPEELGASCAFLCSVQAGYITGQNLLIDGGAYPGTL